MLKIMPSSHRDPEHFPRILAFLRDGVVEEVPPLRRASLLREAQFYSLDPVIMELEVCCEQKEEEAVDTNEMFLWKQQIGLPTLHATEMLQHGMGAQCAELEM